MVIERPQTISDAYEKIWRSQPDGLRAIDYFLRVREQYNAERDSERLLFLILRCVANAVRFAKNGNFSQSADKRRRGTHPDRVRNNIFATSKLLKGKTEYRCADFAIVAEPAASNDLIYMDPPYQGTTEGADKRYFEQLDRERLILCLRQLNSRGVPFILSYDGQHGEKTYGSELPADIHAHKLLVKAGRSTQGTLNGKDVTTYESIYLSPHLPPPRDQPQLSFALM
jgi:DNA adenine methylase